MARSIANLGDGRPEQPSRPVATSPTVAAAGNDRRAARARRRGVVVRPAQAVRVRDREAGSTRDATSRAVAGPLRGWRVAPLASWTPTGPPGRHPPDTAHQLPSCRAVRGAIAIMSPLGPSILREHQPMTPSTTSCSDPAGLLT